jgi:MOSC domain-containing protein YiiM
MFSTESRTALRQLADAPVLIDNGSLMENLTMSQLEAGLHEIRRAPKDAGSLSMIVRRPATEQREVLHEGLLDLTDGLVGDNWKQRGSHRTPDKGPNPNAQITVMNSRAVSLLAGNKDRWQLAGDQLFVDLDLSLENLPAGTRLAIGGAVIEVSADPHTGCKKFTSRYGLDAMNFVNSPVGRELCLRGINAKVVQPGKVRVGDTINKLRA